MSIPELSIPFKHTIGRLKEKLPITDSTNVKYFIERYHWVAETLVEEFYEDGKKVSIDAVLKDVFKLVISFSLDNPISDLDELNYQIATCVYVSAGQSGGKSKVSDLFFIRTFVFMVEIKWFKTHSWANRYCNEIVLNLEKHGLKKGEIAKLYERGIEFAESKMRFTCISQEFIAHIIKYISDKCSSSGKEITAQSIVPAEMEQFLLKAMETDYHSIAV